MIQHTFTCRAGTVTYSPPAGPLGESQGTYPNKRQDLYEVVNAMLTELDRQHAEIARLTDALDDAQAAESVAQLAAEALRAELARERASRQQAQIDLERAKEDRNRAVIETRRKVAEERAACFGESCRDAVEYRAETIRTRSDK